MLSKTLRKTASSEITVSLNPFFVGLFGKNTVFKSNIRRIEYLKAIIKILHVVFL